MIRFHSPLCPLPVPQAIATAPRARTWRHGALLGLLVFATTWLAGPSLAAPAVTALAKPTPRQVLFVGNSYFYYNDSLHNHVRRLTDAAGAVKMDDQKFRSITISGGSLAHHPIAHYMTPGAIGYKKPFDLVILQGNSGAALSDKGAKAFGDAARQASTAIKATGAQVALYMTHAYAKEHKKYDAASAGKIEKLYVDVGNEIGALVLPVGRAFENALRERPDLRLHNDQDASHPNLAGTYLAACVVMASLYGVSPVGNPYDYYGKLDKDTTAYLQKIADQTVREFFGR